MFRPQAEVNAKRHQRSGYDELVHADLQPEQGTLSSVIEIEGATGILSKKVNGRYSYVNDSEYHKEPERAQENCVITLLNDPGTSRWIIGQTLADGGDTLVLAYCGMAEVCDPCDTKRWFVCNASSTFLVHPCMRVNAVDVNRNLINNRIAIDSENRTSFVHPNRVDSNSNLCDDLNDNNNHNKNDARGADQDQRRTTLIYSHEYI